MSQASGSTTIETLVGAAVVALAAGFFIYAYQAAGIGKGSGAGGYRLIAEFDNASGVNVGADVRLAGIKIGTVTSSSLDAENYMARLELTIDKTVELSDDSAAKVTAEGLLGGNFIKLEPGGSDTKMKEGDAFSYTQGAVDIWSLISQAMFSSSEKKQGDTPAPAEPPPQ
ncbi:MAG: outer membrane lipid asymmetry maintenance protein MlaD [Proteobacteria bacterium]|nr:outer membrane lipid asymmetry maintenance protein MlaD [Pseudomonadota bacterium]